MAIIKSVNINNIHMFKNDQLNIILNTLNPNEDGEKDYIQINTDCFGKLLITLNDSIIYKQH